MIVVAAYVRNVMLGVLVWECLKLLALRLHALLLCAKQIWRRATEANEELVQDKPERALMPVVFA